MENNKVALTLQHRKKNKQDALMKRITRHRDLYIMLIPAFIIVALFNYAPIGGLIIAFKDYNFTDGIFGSRFVGFIHFRKLFSDPTVIKVITNTLLISFYKLIWGLPFPIILALALNEIRLKFIKKTVQTVSYLPHFISWVIVAGMVNNILSPTGGVIPLIITRITGKENISILTEPKFFRSLLVITDLWKEAGWNSVIYMAALSGIDVTQYEAASIDGANRIQKIRLITLPALTPLIVTVTVLACGNILNAGFDQIFNMQNSMVRDVSDIIDTYVYRIGMIEMSYSFSSAVGLFKSLTGLIMLVFVNALSRKISDSENAIW